MNTTLTDAGVVGRVLRTAASIVVATGRQAASVKVWVPFERCSSRAQQAKGRED